MKLVFGNILLLTAHKVIFASKHQNKLQPYTKHSEFEDVLSLCCLIRLPSVSGRVHRAALSLNFHYKAGFVLKRRDVVILNAVL